MALEGSGGIPPVVRVLDTGTVTVMNNVISLAAMLFLAFSPIVLANAASADVKVRTSTAYYQISGKDGKALNQSMLDGGKSRIKLTHAIAATETTMDFTEPKLEVVDGKCKITDVDVILNIKYIYPKWSGRSGASSEMRKRWDAFWAELKRHEENHGKIAIAGAKRFEKALLDTTAFAFNGCAGFVTIAKVKLNQIVRQTEQAQKNFDRAEYAFYSKISKLQRALYEAR